MSLTPSTMLPLGTGAPAFTLPDTTGKTVSSADFREVKALLVMFICNHCPYVKHVKKELVRLAGDYQPKSVAVVAINANDVSTHPEDSPEDMAKDAAEFGYTFPYLYDETQEVAKAYRAACTPDFFLFDESKKLVYRGQLDDSRPGNDIPVTGKDIRDAIDRTLRGDTAVMQQKPSMGCNIKWKAGNEPAHG
jgi:peroxiredoxin